MKARFLIFLFLFLALTACAPRADQTNTPCPQPSATPEETQPTATIPPTRTAIQALEDEPASIIWSKAFTGPEYGAFFDLIPLANGNFIVVGATNHLHVPPYSGDALLMQLSPEGETIWEETWGGDGYEQAWAVSPAADGGVMIFGETDSFGAGDRDFFLLKTDPEGAEEWFQTYGGPFRE